MERLHSAPYVYVEFDGKKYKNVCASRVLIWKKPRHRITSQREVDQRRLLSELSGGASFGKLVGLDIVPMTKQGKLFTYSPVIASEQAAVEKWAAELVADEIGSITAVSAFQAVPAAHLGDLDLALNIVVLLSGNDEHALGVVTTIA